MKTRYTVVLSMIAGAALGAAAIQGLHAQAKPKAYVISETEVIDAAAQAVYIPLVRAAQNAAGGRSFHTAGGKVVALEGGASQACSHHRVGQPGEGGGILQIQGLGCPCAASRQGNNPALRRRSSELSDRTNRDPRLA